MASVQPEHGLARIARQSQLDGADSVVADSRKPIGDAWQDVCRACNLEEGNPVDLEVEQAIAFSSGRSAAIAAGMRHLQAVARDWIRSGYLTLPEADRVLGELGEPPSADRSVEPHVLVVDDEAMSRRLSRRTWSTRATRSSGIE